jgi:hypothetical protein
VPRKYEVNIAQNDSWCAACLAGETRRRLQENHIYSVIYLRLWNVSDGSYMHILVGGREGGLVRKKALSWHGRNLKEECVRGLKADVRSGFAAAASARVSQNGVGP